MIRCLLILLAFVVALPAQAEVSVSFYSRDFGEVFPHARRSTINFGIAPLSGTLVSKLEMIDLEQMLRQAIIDFEPRILPDSLVVRGVAPVDPLGHHNSLSFEINARLWAQPYPLELLLKTDLDLETGLVELKDRSGTTILGA